MTINGVKLFSSNTKININNHLINKQKEADIKLPRGDTIEISKVLKDADFNIVSDEIRCKSTQRQIEQKLRNLKGFTEN